MVRTDRRSKRGIPLELTEQIESIKSNHWDLRDKAKETEEVISVDLHGGGVIIMWY